MTLHEKEDETEIDQVRLKDVRRSGSKVFGRAISRQTQAAVRRAEKELIPSKVHYNTTYNIVYKVYQSGVIPKVD
jgi:hypothetical protein